MSKKINLAGLDFDQIKANLKEYLRGQEKFSDFDFEGSNMSLLLDILAYNTHYNALYTNMALNEAFLDSASNRNSVVSLATSLGYVPRSFTCASTVVDFRIVGVTPDNSNTAILPKYTRFQGIKDNVAYSFYTQQAASSSRDSVGNYQFSGIKILEGEPVESRFEYTEQNSIQIPNSNVDLSTLTVLVQDSPSSSKFQVFTHAAEFATVNGDDLVYFLRELDGFYQISFGDGVVGKEVEIGSIVNIAYMACSGAEPNGIKLITYSDGSLNGGTLTNLTIRTQVEGGSSGESIDEIKFNAPNFYGSQNRAVTKTDYEALLLKNVPYLAAVSVWGGEMSTPPVYGKVYISGITKTGRNLSQIEKAQIKEFVLNKFKVVGITPEFVNPTTVRIDLDVVSYFDQSQTTSSPEGIRASIIDQILAYSNSTDFGRFSRSFRSNTLQRIVDGVNPAITSTIIRFKVSSELDVAFGTPFNYTLNFGTLVSPRSLTSTKFFMEIDGKTHEVSLFDDGSGKILANGTTFNGIVGEIDYVASTIKLNNMKIIRLKDTALRIFVGTETPDVNGIANQILRINNESLRVSVIVDNATTTGGFQFTTNRI